MIECILEIAWVPLFSFTNYDVFVRNIKFAPESIQKNKAAND